MLPSPESVSASVSVLVKNYRSIYGLSEWLLIEKDQSQAYLDYRPSDYLTLSVFDRKGRCYSRQESAGRDTMGGEGLLALLLTPAYAKGDVATPRELGSCRLPRLPHRYRYGRLLCPQHRDEALLRVWRWLHKQTGLCGVMKHRIYCHTTPSKAGADKRKCNSC
jgi:hypothetical protein